MLATNEIKPRVEAIVNAIKKDSGKQSPEDVAAAQAIADLVTSTLEAFHDLVWYIQQFESRDANRR